MRERRSVHPVPAPRARPVYTDTPLATVHRYAHSQTHTHTHTLSCSNAHAHTHIVLSDPLRPHRGRLLRLTPQLVELRNRVHNHPLSLTHTHTHTHIHTLVRTDPLRPQELAELQTELAQCQARLLHFEEAGSARYSAAADARMSAHVMQRATGTDTDKETHRQRQRETHTVLCHRPTDETEEEAEEEEEEEGEEEEEEGEEEEDEMQHTPF